MLASDRRTPWPPSHPPERRRLLHALILGSTGWGLGGLCGRHAWALPPPRPLVNAGVVLLQPEETLQARVRDADAFAAYTARVEQAAAQALQADFRRKPNSGFFVLALRPGGGVRLWLDLDETLPPALALAVQTAVQALPPPDVVGGLVLVSFKASLWSGRPTARRAPAPAEWRAAAQGLDPRPGVEELVDRVWPP